MGNIRLYKVSATKTSKPFFKTSSFKLAEKVARKHNMSRLGKQTDKWKYPYHVAVYGKHPVYGWGYFTDGMLKN